MNKCLHRSPIRIAIVEDDKGLRENMHEWLGRQAALSCIGAFASAESAIDNFPRCLPDVWLVDINLPGLSGIAFVARLSAAQPCAKALMLTAYEDGDRIFEALKAGAIGYLLKRHAARQLLSAIQQLQEGGAPMSPEVARKVVAHFHMERQAGPDLAALTARERDILDQLSKGSAYKEIADHLHIAIDTVRSHLRSIYDKLHVHSRTEAVVKYLGK